MSSRTKFLTALGLVLVALLAWKLGVDWARAIRAERGEVAVTGFRSAHFGDTEDQVRAAIARDFPGTDIQSSESPVEKTKLLVIRVKDILPDSGNAQAIYVLGYKSKTLMQVNIFWGTQLTPGLTPRQLGITAAVLQAHFAAQDFVPSTITRDKKLPTGAVLVFAGKDSAGHLVRLLYQEAAAGSDQPHIGQAAEIAALRLSYIQDPKNPDIFKVEDGKF